ncbi:unnamed protein product [Cylindrotheca closterium]|uniref:Uncharacterized protein n=1 Tax=Cylindrotheca closterium TaxID=2856 RepID=A0AAD2CFL9_9STRA|nr:unnamed protein product [Cylindrotheca closterium]
MGFRSFRGCKSLANLALPQESKAILDPFDGCALLKDRFGAGPDAIIAGLTKDEEFPLEDEAGMTPFHVLLSTIRPRRDLLQVLVDKFPYQVLRWKDANDKLATV